MLADDTIRVVRIVLRMLFYGTPIIYTPQHRPRVAADGCSGSTRLSGILELYRAGFFPAPLQVPPLVTGRLISVGLLVWGAVAFARMERAVLKEI